MSLDKLKIQGGKLIRYMVSKGYQVDKVNIVGLEGVNAIDWVVNKDTIDEFNDTIAVVSNDGTVYISATATTEPGWHYRKNRMNPSGAFQLAFGQYINSHCLGKHFKQNALVQCGVLKGYRDNNEDGSRSGDQLFSGTDFGVNIHTTGNDTSATSPNTVGRWSAGCQVFKHASTFYNEFMPLCRSMGVSKFNYTLVDGSDFAKFK
jgi:hypothetical protein